MRGGSAQYWEPRFSDGIKAISSLINGVLYLEGNRRPVAQRRMSSKAVRSHRY